MSADDRALDDRQIRDVVSRYCRGIDRLDEETIRSCYHPDADEHHGTFHGNVDEFIVWVLRVLNRYTSTMHLVGQTLIEFSPDTDDLARSESVGIAIHRTTDGPPELNLDVGFRYLDRFERRSRPGSERPQWRIAQRVATTEWIRAVPDSERWPIPPTMVTGRRDGTDPVVASWSDGADWPWSAFS